MTERLVVDLAVGLGLGTGVGFVFFGGLWLTVRELPTSSRPAVLAGLSLLFRLAVLAGGLFLLAHRGLLAIAVGTATLLLVRTVLVRRVGTPPEQGDHRWT